MESLKELLNKHSYKIKPIFLELFNYSYKHAPLKEDDKRFIGRSKLERKIRSFISSSSTKSGAYLVTGFRGMGKTSVVNRALSIYKTSNKTFTTFFYLFVISQLSLFSYELKFLGVELIAFYSIVIVLSLTVLGYLAKGNQSATNWKNKNESTSFFKGMLNILFELFFINKLTENRYHFQRVLKTIVIYASYFAAILFIHWIRAKTCDTINITIFQKFWTNIYVLILTFFTVDRIKWDLKINKKNKLINITTAIIPAIVSFSSYFMTIIFLPYSIVIHHVILIICLLILVAIKFYKSWQSNENRPQYESNLNKLKNTFGFQKQLVININLGKDNLTEKDVLKYTVNEILIQYKKWRNNYLNIQNLQRLLVPLLTIYLVFVIISKQKSIRQFKVDVIKEFEIYKILPSQTFFFSDEELINKDEHMRNFINIDCSDISKFRHKICDVITEQIITKQTDISFTKKVKIYNSYWCHISNEILTFHKICHFLDLYINKIYYKIRSALISDNYSAKLNFVYPLLVDYILFFTVFLVYILILLLRKYNFFGLQTHQKQVNNLLKLKEKIEASVSFEKTGNMPVPGGIYRRFPLFSKSKKMSYSPLDTKEIESELILILKQISKIPTLFTKLYPIFVYDELDKISIYHNTTLNDKREEDPSNRLNYKYKRQESVTNILSSLKSFLNNAPAKFIFIAGRDMYDAALAGISDRQSVLDSIFHKNKLYVNSFYTELEDGAVNDITSMTEKYVCQFLIPDHFYAEKQMKNKDAKKDLMMYTQYLLKLSKDSIIKKSEIQPILFNLINFFSYITYRSNGAPKKISNILEQFITPIDPSELVNKGEAVIQISSNTDRLHLKFAYYDQYRLAYTSYLVSPIFLRLSNYMNEFGDKMLVSISYLLDHIFKHNKFGFSTKNLSLTPEIIDINKEPEFRGFLQQIINDFSISHLRKIVSGLHEYRFNSIVSSELRFLTKVSDIESAAFNFTLDESLETKRFFKKKLNELKKSYGESANVNYINSISFYHMTIGDLHFFDQEYSDSTINYLEAVQTISNDDPMNISPYLLILYLRNSLKLGLSLEKEGVNKSALMKYTLLSDLIMKRRDIVPETVGLARFAITRDEAMSDNLKDQFEKVLEEEGKIFEDELDELFKEKKEIIVLGRLKEDEIKMVNENKIFSFNKLKTLYDIDGSKLANKIEKLNFTDYPNQLSLKFSALENIRLLYQPIIAKLHLLEKSAPNGVDGLTPY